jgi:hypothetical protein
MPRSSLLAVVLGALFAALTSPVGAQELDCGPERLAEAYPEVRKQFEALLDGRDATVTWTGDQERVLDALRGCPDRVGRRVAFYYAIARLVRGEPEQATQLVRELERAPSRRARRGRSPSSSRWSSRLSTPTGRPRLLNPLVPSPPPPARR